MLELVHNIATANQIAKDAVERELSGLTASQARFLVALAANDGTSQTVITGETNIDRSTVADVSRRLLKLGMITRKRTSEDARRYAVRLTDAGRAKVSQIKKAEAKIAARILAEVIGADKLAIRQAAAE